MQINRAEYVINGVKINMIRVGENRVRVEQRGIRGNHEYQVTVDSTKLAFNAAKNIYFNCHGVHGTEGDIMEIHHALIAFEI